MKKIFKSLCISALLLPCLFMFTACGGEKDTSLKVDVSGNYTPVESSQDALNYITTAQGENDFNIEGIKFSISIQSVQENIKMNGTISNNSVDPGFIVDMTYIGEKFTFYYHEDQLHIKLGNLMYKVPTGQETNEMINILEQLPSPETISSLVDTIQLNDILSCEKSEADNIEKYYFKVQIKDSSDWTEVWFIFESGVFKSFKSISSLYSDGVSVKSEMNIEIFNGKISYPSFEGAYDLNGMI